MLKRILAGLVCNVLALTLLPMPIAFAGEGDAATLVLNNESSEYLNSESYGQLPLIFIPNRGQLDERVDFVINGKDKGIYFTAEGLTYVLIEQGEEQQSVDELSSPREIEPDQIGSATSQTSWVVKLDFVEARQGVRPESLEEAETVISYFKGKSEEWQAGFRASSKIIYRDLWPGIDLVYSGTVNRLKYEFIVHPGADPSQIKLAYRGANSVKLNENGQLEISTPIAAFSDDLPLAWQGENNTRREVKVAYALNETTNSGVHTYSFDIGAYDTRETLILDPAMLVYCGFLGGGGDDFGNGLAVDNSGAVYLTGHTNSNQMTFPVIVGPDLVHNGGFDAFIAKINPTGSSLEYCSYLGGSGYDSSWCIAIDTAGNAYVAGQTASNNFPVTVGPFLTYNAKDEAFVAKVNSAGTALVYCGYLGGTQNECAYGIAVDAAGNACVTGQTGSGNFPVVNAGWANATTLQGGSLGKDAFVAKVNPTGTALAYSGYLGGTGYDLAKCIAVDVAGDAFVSGETRSTDFPIVNASWTNATGYQGGVSDAFMVKINPTGSALTYSGYFGGSGNESAYGIAVDASGSAYLAGQTSSPNLSVVNTAWTGAAALRGNTDAFVAKINPAGIALDYCGYCGGDDVESASSITVDTAGNAYVAGTTYSANFPAQNTAWDNSTTFQSGPGLFPGADAYIAKINPSGTTLVWSGYLGGSTGNDSGNGIAVDPAGRVYVAGTSFSANFPVTNAGWTGSALRQGTRDAFVAKIAEPTLILDQPFTPSPVGAQHTLTATFKLDGVSRQGIRIDFIIAAGPNAGKNGSNITGVNGQAGFTYTGDGGSGIDTIQATAFDQTGDPLVSAQASIYWISTTVNSIGGVVIGVNRLAILIPWLVMIFTLMLGGTILVLSRKER
jgi:hypothetical protein